MAPMRKRNLRACRAASAAKQVGNRAGLLGSNTRSHSNFVFPTNRTRSGAAQMPRLTDPTEDVMAYLGSVPVKKFLEGISRFQKDVYPQHQDLFEKLAMGQRLEALFITCADSRIDP